MLLRAALGSRSLMLRHFVLRRILQDIYSTLKCTTPGRTLSTVHHSIEFFAVTRYPSPIIPNLTPLYCLASHSHFLLSKTNRNINCVTPSPRQVFAAAPSTTNLIITRYPFARVYIFMNTLSAKSSGWRCSLHPFLSGIVDVTRKGRRERT